MVHISPYVTNLGAGEFREEQKHTRDGEESIYG